MSEISAIVITDEEIIAAIPEELATNPGIGDLGELIESIAAQVASGLTWQIAAASQNMQTRSGYIITALSLTQLYLPTVAAQGDQLAIYGLGVTGWRLNQAIGQQIRIGNKTTTLGASGYVGSTDRGDWLSLTFLGGLWVGTGMHGNLEVA